MRTTTENTRYHRLYRLRRRLELRRYKRLYNRRWRAAHPAASAVRDRHYYEQHRREARAQRATQRALKRGTLTRGPCEVCGTDLFVVAHHDSYERPYHIRWLCRAHDKACHAKGTVDNSPPPAP